MKRDSTYLRYILETITRIEYAVSGGKDLFIKSTVHQDAVLRNLHTMTETTQRLSAALKSSYPKVEWASLAAFRNVLVHNYLGLDIELIWQVATTDVPSFKKQVERMLDNINET
ncbi:MAG: HepT-like ribonuclease domain-containing protein [Acidobacteriota bacterium]|nr:HepT-like ribonuclease domain-containing protein [Acidobacteriota bacterium]